MTNDAQLSMMKNMLNSALKANYPMNLFHCYLLNSEKEQAIYGTPQFKSITIRKLEVILANMQLDSEVLWIDNDIVLFENVIPDLRSKPGQFIMQDDIWSPCTGFFLVRSTALAIQKIKLSISWLHQNSGNTSVNDQHAVTASFKKLPFVSVTLLDKDQYPNGEIYFNQKRTSIAKIVHCNYLTNTSEKIVRFKEHNLWDESDTAFEMVNKYSL